MADTKITALAAITTVAPANDLLPIVDVNDNSMAASGTTKNITINQILGAGGTATLASATITGDLTVDTSTLKVDSTNNRVGIGTASPAAALNVSLAEVSSAAGTSAIIYNLTGGGNRIAALRLQNLSNQWNIRAFGSGADDFRIGSGSTGSEVDYLSIGNTGICTWSNVGGVAGTAMTLNSTGLGIGDAPTSGEKLTVLGNIYVKSANRLKLDNASNNFGAQIYNTGASGQAALAFVLGATQAMTLDASGNLLVGTTGSLPSFADGRIEVLAVASSYCIVSDATASSASGIGIRGNDNTVAASFYNASTGATVGSIVINSGGVSYNTTSDYRLKQDVQPLVGGLARISALKPSIYKWKAGGSNGEGFIAHELAEVVPLAVTGEKDAVNADGSIKPQGVDLSKVVPILVAAIQELTARVQTLEAK